MGIAIHSLYKKFGAFTAVNGVNVEIADGDFFVMLGSSGCGKTTTLRMIAGLEMPTSGQILINGKDVTWQEPRERNIAMAFQDYGLYPHLSIYQNIEFPLKVRKLPEAQRKQKVEDTAEKLGITQFLARKPGQLSGGQRQRVSLARALVRNPSVFLMDEPLSNLDAKLRASMRTEIKKLVTELGITTVYVTHDQVEAMSMADRIAVMKDGNMVQVAAPLEVYQRPKTEFVADFIGCPPMNLFPAKAHPGGVLECGIPDLVAALPAQEVAKVMDMADRNGRLFVGVRPEHLRLAKADTAGSIAARIELIEPLGQTTNVYVESHGQRFIVVTDHCAAQAGDHIGIAADPAHLRLVAHNQPKGHHPKDTTP